MKAPPSRWLVTLGGMAAGLVLSLAYAWLILPPRSTNASPALLRSDHRREWIHVAALSYLADGDLERLETRVVGLEDVDVKAGLQYALDTSQDAAIAGSVSIVHSRALADAFDLRHPRTQAADILLAQPAPKRRASGALFSFAFRLVQRSHVCQALPAPRIEVTVLDADGEAMPGMRLWLIWDDGADQAVTGLMPERGRGYADFDVAKEVSYSLGVGEYGIALVRDLRVMDCPPTEDGEQHLGSWRIVIQQRPVEGERN